jgi:glycosyltransferase involved in cell wall biosynthesis
MMFTILDPNLVDDHGHHLRWDLAIAAAAAKAGHPATIVANRRFAADADLGVSLIPHFSHTTYETRSADRFTAAHDDFEYFNSVLLQELAALPISGLRTGDVVLVPTVSENHLLGYLRWMKSFAADAAPRFVVHLMFPPGIRVEQEGLEVVEPFRAQFYRLAFRKAAAEGPEILFFGGGRQLAEEFSQIAGIHIPPHAIPLAPERGAHVRERPEPTALLFAGDAKPDKGFLLVPQLAEALCGRHPDWHFAVHANTTIGGANMRQAFDSLEALARRNRKLTVYGGRLSEDDYHALLESADCMIVPYDPAAYTGKSSGIVWECISLGIPLVVPRQTWLEREAVLWGAGCVAYQPHTIEGISKAFAAMSSDLAGFRENSVAAARNYRTVNGADAVVRQIIEHAAAPPYATEINERTAPADDMLVRAEAVQLAQHSSTDRFRHLDIVALSVRAGADSWPRLKFKLVRNAKGTLLEFRQGAGWPAMFHAWPSADSDRFGPVLRLVDDESLSATIAAWREPQDMKLLGALSALLPSAVRMAVGQTELPSTERDEWISAAAAMSEHLAAALAARAAS